MSYGCEWVCCPLAPLQFLMSLLSLCRFSGGLGVPLPIAEWPEIGNAKSPQGSLLRLTVLSSRKTTK